MPGATQPEPEDLEPVQPPELTPEERGRAALQEIQGVLAKYRVNLLARVPLPNGDMLITQRIEVEPVQDGQMPQFNQ